MDVGGGDLRVAGQNYLRVFEIAGGVAGVAWDAGYLDEGSYRIGEVGLGADEVDGLYPFRELNAPPLRWSRG